MPFLGILSRVTRGKRLLVGAWSGFSGLVTRRFNRSVSGSLGKFSGIATGTKGSYHVFNVEIAGSLNSSGMTLAKSKPLRITVGGFLGFSKIKSKTEVYREILYYGIANPRRKKP